MYASLIVVDVLSVCMYGCGAVYKNGYVVKWWLVYIWVYLSIRLLLVLSSFLEPNDSRLRPVVQLNALVPHHETSIREPP